MPIQFYIRLIALTAGTLVYLFLIALILGHRRPRKLERLLFFLVLSVFLIYAGGLLEMNAWIRYGALPDATRMLCAAMMDLGGAFLLPLIWHAHVEYARVGHQTGRQRLMAGFILPAYGVGLGELVLSVAAWWHGAGFLGPATISLADPFTVLAFAICAASATFLEAGILREETSRSAIGLGKWLVGASSALFIFLAARFILISQTQAPSDWLATAAIAAGIVPGAALIYFALKRNFLEYGAQRNLVYALSATFLGVLYLALVHRVSGWLEAVLPPEATSAILLFVLIFLFEPLERAIGPALHRRVRERMEGLQRLTTELQEQARQGSMERLVRFTERRVGEEFGLAAVRVSVPAERELKPLEAPGGLGHVVRIPLQKEGKQIGLLEAASTGAYLTGETSAALEFLAEQLPGMVDLAKAIEEKIGLERELAERERLALLGQMAASLSHNLRNPLSSMKTILQVQLENPDLPLDVRHDSALVVEEINRMSEKLKQLLNFAKAPVNGQSVEAVALARRTASLFGRDAERRNLRLEFDGPAGEVRVAASEEALSEVLSNLIVNAIEAQPAGGRVRVRIATEAGALEMRVEDDGPGIPAELREKIFEPYFTTKASGTGLGLSIVSRRVAEMGGTIACESPVREEKGTRFVVRIPGPKN